MQRTNRSRGIVTTELALGLLFVITVLAFCCGLLGLAIMQGECEDLATQVARMEARGDHAAAARAEAGAPADARVSLRTEGGWVVVVDRKGQEGIGSSARLAVPPQMVELVLKGMELGDAVDAIFHQQNSKQSQGHFGLMTKNMITRTKAYSDGVLTALARFIHPDIF